VRSNYKQLTPCNTDHPEELRVSQLVNKLPRFQHRVHKTAIHRYSEQDKSVHSFPSHCLKITFYYPSHNRLEICEFFSSVPCVLQIPQYVFLARIISNFESTYDDRKRCMWEDLEENTRGRVQYPMPQFAWSD
jgi:hypothetical protein